MQKFSLKYPELLYESLQDKYKNNLDQKYIIVKNAILDLIEKSVKNIDNSDEVKKFIADFVANPSNGQLRSFIEDNEIYDFYLKYQATIDEICSNNSYFNDSPKSKNINSLYDYTLQGCKFAVLQCFKILQDEIK